MEEFLPTKNRILDAAILLFSRKGYSRVSVRDIAREANIKASSIYHHFPSKAHILKVIYEYYLSVQSRLYPDIEGLLLQAESLPPHEIIKKMLVSYQDGAAEVMDRIASIGIMEFRSDPQSADFIDKSVLMMFGVNLKRILSRMIELKRIEPIDVEAFSLLVTNNMFALNMRYDSPFPAFRRQQKTSYDLLYSLIKPVEAEEIDATISMC